MRVVARGPTARACDYLTTPARRDLVDYWQEDFSRFDGVPRVHSCADAFRALEKVGSYHLAVDGVMDFCLAIKLPKAVKVREAVAMGDRATARIADSRKPIRLRRVRGHWRVDAQDFRDAPAPDESASDAEARSCARG